MIYSPRGRSLAERRDEAQSLDKEFKICLITFDGHASLCSLYRIPQVTESPNYSILSVGLSYHVVILSKVQERATSFRHIDPELSSLLGRAQDRQFTKYSAEEI